jgi:hypothetical protein
MNIGDGPAPKLLIANAPCSASLLVRPPVMFDHERGTDQLPLCEICKWHPASTTTRACRAVEIILTLHSAGMLCCVKCSRCSRWLICAPFAHKKRGAPSPLRHRACVPACPTQKNHQGLQRDSSRCPQDQGPGGFRASAGQPVHTQCSLHIHCSPRVLRWRLNLVRHVLTSSQLCALRICMSYCGKTRCRNGEFQTRSLEQRYTFTPDVSFTY